MKIFIKILLMLVMASNLKAQFSGGTGDPGSPFEIRTLSELEAVSDFPDKCFILKKNIRDSLRKPLCEYFNPFTGEFNGNGFIINLSINADTNYFRDAALFYTVAGNAIIKNVVVAGKVRGFWASGVVNIADSGFNFTDNNVQIINCVNIAKITGNQIAGIVAAWWTTGKIEGCLNLGVIEGDYGVSGINGASYIGFNKIELNIENCINSGWVYELKDKNYDYYDIEIDKIGGIALCHIPVTEISNCLNVGVVTRINYDVKKIGGIAPKY